MHVAPLLFSAAAGYWVLERAQHQRGRLRALGRGIGWLIIVVSIAGVACRSYAMMTGACAGGKFSCPFKNMAPPAMTK